MSTMLVYMCIAGLAVGQLPSIEEKYAIEITKADAEFVKVKAAAADVRLKSYREALVLATKSGNFDKAISLKSRIEELEKDPKSQPLKRSRPKDVVRFQGHSYALIKESVTWHIAKHRCEEMGGHLATGETPQQLAFLSEFCQSSGVQVWIGCSRESDDTWRWLNGDAANLPGASLDNVGDIEFHLHWNKDTKRWNDAPAGWKFSYACEWDK